VPSDLTVPTAAFRRRAWAAVAALVAFLIFYAALVGWLVSLIHKAWVALGQHDGVTAGLAILVPACVLLLFLVKGIFVVRRGGTDHLVEVTEADEPTLLAFVHRVADEAGAPRPHRVFLSARVNAAVFYDRSLWNLIVPSKKNLEIGLGLVNSLSLDEFKAVIAHEFGHFAQRTMTVGSWVYLSQQIVGDLVSRRDGFDHFLDGLSRVDLRIAWIGWLLRLLVWAIRAVVDTAFRGVVLLERALSREMEFQADLAAVALTGSDSLVHGLHRLGPADAAWDRAADFCSREFAGKRPIADLFTVQARVVEQTARITSRPEHGQSPRRPATGAAAARVFQSGIAEAPRMWSTHPPNHEREENAKRRYIASILDERPAWVLFRDPAATRQRLTAHLFRPEEKKERPQDLVNPAAAVIEEEAPRAPDAGLDRLDRWYDKPSLDPRYRGAWLERPVARYEAEAARLCGELPANPAEALAGLFPASLADVLARIREREAERAQLEGLREGFLQAPGGVLRFRGRSVRHQDLPGLIEDVSRELRADQEALHAHDRRVRAAHRGAARAVGKGWEPHLDALLTLLHYAEHSEADVDDAIGAFRNVLAVVTADGSVSNAERRRLVAAGADVVEVLRPLCDQRASVKLPADLAARLGGPWNEILPAELHLHAPTVNEIGSQWIEAMDSWVNLYSRRFGALRNATLDTLVAAEEHVARCLRSGADPGDAPSPAVVPARFARLVTGAERPRQRRLGWWDRFQLAEGPFAGVARLAVAGLVLAPAVAATRFATGGTLVVHNGLQTPVIVSLDGKASTVAPGRTERFEVGDEPIQVRTSTPDGEEIEAFDGAPPDALGTVVYNVAGASALVERTVTYGRATPRSPRLLGTVRWNASRADHVFEGAPSQISTKGGGDTREVLEALDAETVQTQLAVLEDDEARAALALTHLRWDPGTAADLPDWAEAGWTAPGAAELIAARLARPDAPLWLRRAELNHATPERKESLCAGYRQAGEGADETYLRLRCLPDGAEQDQGFVDAHLRFPEHPWLAWAAGGVLRGRDDVAGALAAWTPLLKRGSLGRSASDEVARLRRLASEIPEGTPQPGLGNALPGTVENLASETWKSPPADADPFLAGHWLLAHGDAAGAEKRVKASAALGPTLTLHIGASDGASAEHVAAALALEPQRNWCDAWIGLALAERQGRDGARFREAAAAGALPQAVTEALRREGPPARLDAALAGLASVVRGGARAAGIVLWGDAAPASWRREARALMFAWERPFFELR
jgi:Zn-dependent protease with chaperone function